MDLTIRSEMVDGVYEYTVYSSEGEFLGTFQVSVLFPGLFACTQANEQMDYVESYKEAISYFEKLC